MTRDQRLIFPTITWAAGLLLAYAGLIQATHPAITSAPTIGLGNRMFIERYVYGRPATNVLVGSSLTARLPAGTLGPQFTNLALSGEGPLTGLAVVARSPATPRHVYIEINQLSLGSDRQLLDDTFDEPGFTLRRHVMALRKTYQPATLLYALARGHKDMDASGDRPMTATQRADVVAGNRKGLLTPLPQAELARVVAELRRNIDLLRARGVAPVFLEMPIEPGFAELPRPRQVRAAVQAAFSPASNCWIALPLHDARTIDGLHLDNASATAAAALLRAKPHCLNTAR